MKKNIMFFIIAILSIGFYSTGHALEYITCESDDDHLRKCSASSYRDLRDAHIEILNKYSKSGCLEGYSWGVERDAIWVKHGCRAKFVVDFDRYADSGRVSHAYDWDSHDRYNRHDSYDRYNRNSPYDDYDRLNRSEKELHYERERLEREKAQLERERLEDERQRLEKEREFVSRNSTQRNDNSCPSGSRPGRCSDNDRRHGCRDWRISSGQGCRTN